MLGDQRGLRRPDRHHLPPRRRRPQVPRRRAAHPLLRRRARRASLPRVLRDAVVHRAHGRDDDELRRRGRAAHVDRHLLGHLPLLPRRCRRHRELVVAGPAATATIGLEDARGARARCSSARRRLRRWGPSGLAGERGGAALLALDRDPDASAPRIVETAVPAPSGLDLELYVPARAARLPPARGRRGGAPAGDGRVPEVHGRRRR